MKEEWKDVVGYEGLYQVSNKGNVRNAYGKTRKAKIDRYGYETINLSKDGLKKWYAVHRLVAMAFVENPNNYPSVNHIDENKTNNDYRNLEWCTVEYNNKYGERGAHISKTLTKTVKCVETGVIYTAIDAANKFGVCVQAIRKAARLNGKSCGFHWQYIKDDI